MSVPILQGRMSKDNEDQPDITGDETVASVAAAD